MMVHFQAVAAGSPTATAVEAAIGLVFGIVGATVLLAVPGYVLIASASRARFSHASSDREFIARTAVGGIFIHALFALLWTPFLIQRVIDASSLTWQLRLEIAAWAVVVLVVAPVAMGVGVAKARNLSKPEWIPTFLDWMRVSQIAATSDAWEHVVDGLEEGSWMRAWIKRGDRVVAVWGRYSTNSVAGITDSRDLYLEEMWETDSEFGIGEKMIGTKGVWISSDSIVAIELYEGEDDG